MDQMPQYPSNNQTPPPTPQYSGGNSGGVPPYPTSNTNYQPNPTEQRKKRTMYTFVQVILVVFLLISSVFVVQGIFVLGSQFGKDTEATATVSEITDDLGAMIDNSTDGFTSFSSGCRVYYDFTTGEDSHGGSGHTSDHCKLNVGDPIEIVYASNNPINNAIKIDWAPYDMYLIVGGVLLVFSLAMIITSTVLKARVPNPNKPQQY